jgi:hypothetical protein
MTRRLPALIGLVVVVGLGVIAGLLWLAHDGQQAAAPEDALQIDARVDPAVHVFGDPVTATVEVVVDTTTVDLESVRIEPDFSPYELSGPRTVERTTSGGAGVVRFTYPLRCVREGCDASGARGLVEMPVGRVLYRFAGSPGIARAPLDWPAFEVTSRVSDEDVELIRWRAAEATLPAVDRRFDASSLAVALLVVSLALAGVAVWLAWRIWHVPSAETDAAGEADAPAPPLERALALVLDASREGDRVRTRRGLERVALELGDAGRPELADHARSLAWSPREATAGQVQELCDRIRATATAGAARTAEAPA